MKFVNLLIIGLVSAGATSVASASFHLDGDDDEIVKPDSGESSPRYKTPQDDDDGGSEEAATVNQPPIKSGQKSPLPRSGMHHAFSVGSSWLEGEDMLATSVPKPFSQKVAAIRAEGQESLSQSWKDHNGPLSSSLDPEQHMSKEDMKNLVDTVAGMSIKDFKNFMKAVKAARNKK